MIERVLLEGQTYAIIIRKDFHESGIHFMTENNYSQQMAYMHHTKGKIIEAHVHNHEMRNVIEMQEVLVIRKGRLRVDFYRVEREYFGSKVLEEGDIILLASGGHGFEVLEELEMVEIKQGPYLGARDKVRFAGISADQIKWIK